MTKKLISVVGARPNFMKIAPLERQFAGYPDLKHASVHTGQHYDYTMSDVFFAQLGLSQPVMHLGVGSGGHGAMTGKIMVEFEKACLELKPDLVIVVGDVNSTIAAALVARKLLIPVAHVEAGLRSFDETMPEELNRRLTDCLSNLLFVSEESGMVNLAREGIEMSRSHLVGDIMLETLNMFLPSVLEMKKSMEFGLQEGSFALVTVHRPSNVDEEQPLTELLEVLETIPFPKVFPIHPRTVKKLTEFGLDQRINSITDLKLVSPLSYFDFLSLLHSAKMVLSDSGSIQGEASFFNVPCLVCRENTERPVYVEHGTCTLVGRRKNEIKGLCESIEVGKYKESDGTIRDLSKDVSKKIVEIIHQYLF